MTVSGEVPSLEALSVRIKTAHKRSEGKLRDWLHHAVHAGEALIEAKKQLKHGQWLPFLKDRCQLHQRVAQRYMQLARLKAKGIETVVHARSVHAALTASSRRSLPIRSEVDVVIAAISEVLVLQPQLDTIKEHLKSATEDQQRRFIAAVMEAHQLLYALMAATTTAPCASARTA